MLVLWVIQHLPERILRFVHLSFLSSSYKVGIVGDDINDRSILPVKYHEITPTNLSNNVGQIPVHC